MYVSSCVSHSVASVLPCIVYACMYCICDSNSVELQINVFIICIESTRPYIIYCASIRCFLGMSAPVNGNRPSVLQTMDCKMNVGLYYMSSRLGIEMGRAYGAR